MEKEQAIQFFQAKGREIRDLFTNKLDQRDAWQMERTLRLENNPYSQAYEALAGTRAANQEKGRLRLALALGFFDTQPEVENLPTELQSPQERAIRWATDIYDRYVVVPKSNRRERKQAESIVHEAAQRVIAEPSYIDLAGSVWASRALEKTTERLDDNFYAHVRAQSRELAEAKWQEIKPEQLAQVIQAYAHTELTRDLATGILRGYFSGPQNSNDRLGAHYWYVYGALDLVSDIKALEAAIKIGVFESEVIGRNSPNYLDFILARNTYTNDQVLQQAYLIDAYLFALGNIVSLNMDYVTRNAHNFNETDEPTRRAFERHFKEMRRLLGNEEFKRRETSLNTKSDETELIFSVEQESSDYSARWPYRLLKDPADPLVQKYTSHAAPKIGAIKMRQSFSRTMREVTRRDDVTIFSLRMPDGNIAEVFLTPGDEIPNRGVLIDKIKANLPDLNSEVMQKILSEDIPSGTAVYRGFLTEGESPIIYLYRRPIVAERAQHPLVVLEEVGFPVPSIEGRELIATNERLAETIRDEQVRYLNKRGVRVRFRSRPYKRLGYTHVDFAKDRANPEQIQTSIYIGDSAYSVKVDKNLNLDFEGKAFDNQTLHDRLKYVLLSFLRPVLCDEHLKLEGMDSPDSETEILSRMGHLRWLPRIISGKENPSATPQAKANYLREEGKDLDVKNTERKTQRERTNDDRRLSGVPELPITNTTYVKNLMKSEDELPPVVIALPQINI